jgi:hypothetical protein
MQRNKFLNHFAVLGCFIFLPSQILNVVDNDKGQGVGNGDTRYSSARLKYKYYENEKLSKRGLELLMT